MSTEIQMQTLMKGMSVDAQKIVKGSYTSLSTLPQKVWETLEHDGYDDCGPESDIWDLYIVYKSHTGYLVQRYHRENWYDGVIKPYEHYKDYVLKTVEEVNAMTK
jgi:hypothetical protein